MAFVFHPDLGKVVNAQKKGTSKDKSKQYWLDKETGKRFTTPFGAEKNVDQEKGTVIGGTKKTQKATSVTSKEKTIKAKSEPKIITKVKVNSTEIVTVDRDLSIEDAFEMCKTYFREIAQKDCVITSENNEKTITFKIRTGSKG